MSRILKTSGSSFLAESKIDVKHDNLAKMRFFDIIEVSRELWGIKQERYEVICLLVVGSKMIKLKKRNYD